MWLRACAESKGPDQPACLHSLIRAFTVLHQNHWILQNVWIESKGPDDTLDTLRKHTYSNILKILRPKNENFLIKNSSGFLISAQNIDCGYSLELPRRGGSNEYPQSKFSSRTKKNNVYSCKPQFYYIKVGFEGVKMLYVCFRDVILCILHMFEGTFSLKVAHVYVDVFYFCRYWNRQHSS